MKKSDTCVIFSLAYQDFVVPGGTKQAAAILAALGDCVLVRRRFSGDFLESVYQLQESAELSVKVVPSSQIVPAEPKACKSGGRGEVVVEVGRPQMIASRRPGQALIGGRG
jgi:hypothetical protein